MNKFFRYIFLFFLTFFFHFAQAFHYLEHSYITDWSCHEVQKKMVASGIKDADLPKFLALALLCPDTWQKKYCKDDYKNIRGFLNNTNPEDGYSITLGDISSLQDHIPHIGAVKGFPRAKREGLTTTLLEWLLEDESEASGVIEDVAEDACETDELLSWDILNRDLKAFKKRNLSHDFLKTNNRLPLVAGPSDPSGAYSFDNPQFLDMVLNSHYHFGNRAYQAWLGFHNAALDMLGKTCDELVLLDTSCVKLILALKKRLKDWEEHAPRELLNPVKSRLNKLSDITLDQTLTSLIALIFEGSGLHYLQDNMAGGHIRTRIEAYDLGDSREFHELDGQYGVVADLHTARGKKPFVAYGDTYLFGRNNDRYCDKYINTNPTEMTACLLQYNRGLLAASSTASLLDWASGGTQFKENSCDKKHSENKDFICEFLPTNSTTASGSGFQSPKMISKGTLPPEIPDFNFQSITMSLGYPNKADKQQVGVDLKFLSGLGNNSIWLTSWNFSFHQTSGDHLQRYSADFSYMFHYRMAARFLFFGSPYAGISRQKYLNQSTYSLALGPHLGITALPEGWIRLPLEITLGFKAPIVIYDTSDVLSKGKFDEQWLVLSIGLAFM